MVIIRKDEFNVNSQGGEEKKIDPSHKGNSRPENKVDSKAILDRF